PLQRTLLGLLALQAGQPVSPGEIIDVLWGDAPPASCANLVHVYIGQLRDRLEPGRARRAPARLLRRAGTGYLLDLGDDALDARQFDALLARARSATATGELETAERLTADALHQWRGPVLGDLDLRLRQHPAAVSLARRRVTAALSQVDLARQLGRPEQSVEQLQAVAGQEPLHEKVHAALMLALAAAGEQAAALELFAEVHSRLADQLGVGPGPELTDAHLRVLRRQAGPGSGGGAPALPALPPAGVAPAQLPTDIPAFTGRAAELSELDRLVATAGSAAPVGAAVAAVSGMPGVGKTALAVHWAHRVAGLFPDGRLYANLRGFQAGGTSMDPAAAVRGFLHALGVPAQGIPADPDAQVGLYRSLLADRRVLVVLDNARDAEQVRPLLPGVGGSRVVVTSRARLTGLVADGAHPVPVDVLSPDEARRLLGRRLGPARVAAEPEAVAEIVGACGRLPLALTLVAAHAVTRPRLSLAALARGLGGSRGGPAMAAGSDPVTDIRAVFSWSYQGLGPPAARLFRLLGLHPGPDLSAAAAASFAGIPASTARSLLAELAAGHLVDEPVPGRFRCHDLLRGYAADLAQAVDPRDERQSAVRRLLDHYLHTAHAGERLLDPVRDPIPLPPAAPGVTPEQLAGDEPAMAWFTTEHPVLLGALRLAADEGFDGHVWRLAWTLANFLDRRGHWQEWADVAEAAVAAADRSADPAERGRCHRLLAAANLNLDRYADAETHLGLAIELSRPDGDRVGLAIAYHDLAMCCERQGRVGDALHHVEQSLDLFRAAGHRDGMAGAHNGIGWCQTLLGNHEQALDHCEQARALFEELGDVDGQAATWDSLGHAHHQLGDHRRAVACYQRAVELYRSLGDRHAEATGLTQLGDCHDTAGDAALAHTAWRQALTILDELDHPEAADLRRRLGH
ncbi:MAG TPA: tetratricopeptide repeat protein, partial [Mycobacteriales bacterium]|nr:tetratricopeptide repeat protein [Mycobacteriales bacterium]